MSCDGFTPLQGLATLGTVNCPCNEHYPELLRYDHTDDGACWFNAIVD